MGEKEEVKAGKNKITGLETSFSLTHDPALCLQGPVVPLYISAHHPLGLPFPNEDQGKGWLLWNVQYSEALLLLWVLFVLQI